MPQNSFALALQSFWGPKKYKAKKGWGFGGNNYEDGEDEEGDETSSYDSYEGEEEEEEEDEEEEESTKSNEDFEEGEEEGEEIVAANWFLVNVYLRLCFRFDYIRTYTF